MKARNLFNTIAKKAASATGSPWTFLAAVAIVVPSGLCAMCSTRLVWPVSSATRTWLGIGSG